MKPPFQYASPRFARQLLALPESGMGYQWVRARLSGHSGRKALLVLNASRIVPWPPPLSSDAPSPQTGSSPWVDPEPWSGPAPNASGQWQEHRPTYGPFRRHRGGRPAKSSRLVRADGQTRYIRLSAFRNDRRVDVRQRRLLPGSFATTEADYRSCVTFGDDPRERYALPAPWPVRWCFLLLPAPEDRLRKGIVTPAHGRAGGGEEVLFPFGTGRDTLLTIEPHGPTARPP
jgi:hypothetical protein